MPTNIRKDCPYIYIPFLGHRISFPRPNCVILGIVIIIINIIDTIPERDLRGKNIEDGLEIQLALRVDLFRFAREGSIPAFSSGGSFDHG